MNKNTPQQQFGKIAGLVLIESKTTEHTGKIKSDITKSIEDQKY